MEASEKKLRREQFLIGANIFLALGLGYGFAVAPQELVPLFLDRGSNVEIPDAVLASTRVLGALLGGIGLALMALGEVEMPEIRNRVLGALFIGNLFLVLQLAIVQGGCTWQILAVILITAAYRSVLTSRKTAFVGPGEGEEDSLEKRWQEHIREAAAQQERNRLARDLHDSIKQQLFAIRVSSAATKARWDNDPEGARQALEQVQKSAHEATVEMQAMLLQLRPEALANVGLVEAMREQCEAFSYRTGGRFDLEVGDLPPDHRLPPNVQEALFRIAQEALANVARHARAQEVKVHLGSRDQEDGGEALVLEIRDDGQGFDPGRASGMGLRNIRERLRPFAGNLEIDSAPGRGTSLSVVLPLPRDKKLFSKASPEPESLWGNGSFWSLLIALWSILAASVDLEDLQEMGLTGLGLLTSIGFLMTLALSLWLRRPSSNNDRHILQGAPVRLFLYQAAFWGVHNLPGIGQFEFFSWGFVVPGLLMFGIETADFFRRLRRSPQDGERSKPFAVLFLALTIAGIGLAYLVGNMSAAPMILAGSGMLYIAWWLRENF